MKTRTLTMAGLALVLVTGILASGCGSSAIQQPVPTLPVVINDSGITAEGRLEPARFVQVGLNAGGSVDEVLSREGDQVKAGQVLALLKSSQAKTLEAAQADAALELSSAYVAARDAQKQLDDFAVPRVLANMTPPQAVRISLQNLDAARQAFEPYRDTSRKALKPNHHMFSSLPPRVVFDTNAYSDMAKEYKKQVDVGWVNYRKAVTWVGLDADLESARARLAQAQKDYDSLQDASFAENTAGVRAALANAEVRAPFSGTITNLDLKVGEVVTPGTPVATIADLSSWVIKTTNLTEIDVVNIQEGEPVTFTLDALPGVTLRGYVLSVAHNYGERQGDIVYEVTILVSDANPALRWGMTAHVKFEE